MVEVIHKGKYNSGKTEFFSNILTKLRFLIVSENSLPAYLVNPTPEKHYVDIGFSTENSLMHFAIGKFDIPDVKSWEVYVLVDGVKYEYKDIAHNPERFKALVNQSLLTSMLEKNLC